MPRGLRASPVPWLSHRSSESNHPSPPSLGSPVVEADAGPYTGGHPSVTTTGLRRGRCGNRRNAIFGVAMTWTVETLNDAVDRELRALSPGMRARFARISAHQRADRGGRTGSRHLTGPLWEMRLSDRDGIARALYVTARGRRVVVVRVFVKKTRRTPRREIELALRRAGEVGQ